MWHLHVILIMKESESVSRSIVPDSLRLHGLQPVRLLCPGDFPGKDTGMGCHFFLEGVFLTQKSNLSLLHWQVDSLPLSHQGRPYYSLWSLNLTNL